MLLQFTIARLITIYDNVLLQFTIAWLLQHLTQKELKTVRDCSHRQLFHPVITIYDRYCDLRRLLLQFTTGITVHDIITIHDRTVCVECYSGKKILLWLNKYGLKLSAHPFGK